MLLHDLRTATARQAQTDLRRWQGLAGTIAVQRKVAASLRLIETWRASCARPYVSVSGGKDSCLLLALCRQVDSTIPVICATGPVPYHDTPAHLARVEQAAGGPWERVPYTYDIEGVLAGDVRYPAGLKQRSLMARLDALGADGVAYGLRADESRGRQWNLRRRGALYRVGKRAVCVPLARWRAEEVVGWLIAADILPLHPVYTRTYLLPDLNRLRDGTWLPNQTGHAFGQRDWLVYHYPEHAEDYDRAIRIFHHERR